jgi:hypothetical protein
MTIDNTRIQDIHKITKEELLNGLHDIEDYVSVLAGLIREQDFEACEGIRLAIAEYGIRLIIPEEE